VERGAFRVDVCGQQFSVPTEQGPAADVERQLLQLLQPANARLRAQAAAAAAVGAAAVEGLMGGLLTGTEAALARLRRTRRRVSTAPVAAEVAAPTEASLMLGKDDWAAAATPGIVRAGMGAVCASLRSGRGIGVEVAGDVIDGVMSFEIGAGSSAVLGVAVCVAAEVDAPFSSGVMESVVAAMNRHARRHADVRHAWALMLGPGCVRACLLEPDAVHLTAVQSTAAPAGRLLLGTIVASAALAEPWRLGADPTMRWRQDLDRWEIECPGTDDDEPARTVFAQHEPLFIAETFFGRFTRCFAVALSPDDRDFTYILKDSWQLVATDLGDAELRDEIGVLRGMQVALDKVKCEGGVLQRLVCGGTVLVNNARDSTRLVLGPELDSYARWTVAHGSKRTTAAHRLHRRMVSGPVGVALHEMRNERDAVAAVAGAMIAYAAILQHTGILHRDISLGNVLAVRQADGSVRGMLIDFDHSVALDEERNLKRPGHVGTAPFMSIANLEGIDVPRTSVDDWEAALALLLCLAARPSRRDELCARLASIGPSGGADFRRDVFASRKSLEATIAAYLDPACEHALRLIRGLYQALFAHPSCSGTARIMLRGNRLVDPIIRRVQFAVVIHERCLKVVTEYLAKAESEAVPTLMALPKLRFSSISSVGSGSTATIQPPPSKTPMACPLPAHPLLSVLPLPHVGGALRNKRKAHVDVEASPRVKRRKMTHDDVGFAPANFTPHPPPQTPSGADSSTIVGDTRSSASYTAPPADLPGASEVTVAPALVMVSPLNRREALRDEPPPVVSSPKRRRLF
ncbi:hypothetical protein H4S07_001901, partial [Coemansia furcata]